MDLPSNCIYHVLMWNYKDETSPEQRASLEAQLLDLPNRVPALRSVRQGPVVGGRNQSFSHCFIMVFADKQALDEYTAHPQHMEFALPFREACALQVVVDFDTHTPR